MIKLLFTLIAAILFYNEYTFLTVYNHNKIKNIKINIMKFSDTNKTIPLKLFFKQSNWLLTKADKKKKNIKRKIAENTLQIIKQKNSRQLCKGDQCITIKGIISNTLLLQKDEDKIIKLKPGQTIFSTIIFHGIKNTLLFFDNNETNQTYKLKFFSYKLTPYKKNKNKQKDK